VTYDHECALRIAMCEAQKAIASSPGQCDDERMDGSGGDDTDNIGDSGSDNRGVRDTRGSAAVACLEPLLKVPGP